MKVALLFEKKYPAYDVVFRVIQAIPDEDRDRLDTLISAGFWGFLECAEALGLKRVDHMVPLLARLVHNQEGSLTRTTSDDSVVEAIRGDTYVVILHSVRRSLALRLHDLLASTEGYRGFIQVLPHLAVHRQIFGFCPPIVRVEQKSLFVLSTTEDGQDDDDEGSRVVDEMIEWAKARYPLLCLDVAKKHIGFKGTIVDKDSHNAFRTQHAAQRMAEEWSDIAEHVIYKLDDIAPDVVEELGSALKQLQRPRLSAAECGQVAVSLRRSIELLARVLSAGDPERLTEHASRPGPMQEKYKELVWDYLNKRFANNYAVGKDIEYELRNLDRLLNKGVHEHWIMELIQPLAVRTILVMNSLLSPVRAGVVQVRVGDDLFK